MKAIETTIIDYLAENNATFDEIQQNAFYGQETDSGAIYQILRKLQKNKTIYLENGIYKLKK